MKHIFSVLGIALLFGFPLYTNAALLFSEIAWMGTTVSVNDEWIELYNHGSETLNVDGWTITDGVSLEIILFGSIPSRTLALLERTDDDTVPGKPAFLIYTGALANEGRTLTLKDHNGAIQDQVAGGENWENIGGDNGTKETAQRTTTGWVTGTPTPGAENVVHDTNTIGDIEEEDDDDTESTAKKDLSSRDGTHMSLVIPDTKLGLEIDSASIAYVNQQVAFEAIPSGLGKTLVASLSYAWNFGDAETGAGKEITHTYGYPGEYVVVLYSAYARHEALARKTIKVLPVTFSITRTTNGDVQIHNDAKYEVNLSGYALQGEKSFILPLNTILLPNATLTIRKSHIGSNTSMALTLLDQKKVRVASYLVQPPVALAVVTPKQPVAKRQVAAASIDQQKESLLTLEPQAEAVTEIIAPETGQESATEITQAAASILAVKEDDKMTEYLPYAGLGAIIFFGLGALLWSRNIRKI